MLLEYWWVLFLPLIIVFIILLNILAFWAIIGFASTFIGLTAEFLDWLYRKWDDFSNKRQ